LNDTSIPTSTETRDHIERRAACKCYIRGLHLQETVNLLLHLINI